MITTIDNNGAAFIQKQEGCILHAYQDKGGVWTIGYGNTYYEDGTKVKQGDLITQSRADSLFNNLVPIYTSTVLEVSKLLNQGQLNALTSMCWNIGHEGLLTSSLAGMIKLNPNDATQILITNIPNQAVVNGLKKFSGVGEFIHMITYCFLKWNEVDGVFDEDLFERRWLEAKMYWGEI